MGFENRLQAQTCIINDLGGKVKSLFCKSSFERNIENEMGFFKNILCKGIPNEL